MYIVLPKRRRILIKGNLNEDEETCREPTKPARWNVKGLTDVDLLDDVLVGRVTLFVQTEEGDGGLIARSGCL